MTDITNNKFFNNLISEEDSRREFGNLAKGKKRGSLAKRREVKETNKSFSSLKFASNPDWLTTVEAAIFLRKFRKKDGEPSVGAIRNLVYRKKLKPSRIFGRLLFYRPELEKLLFDSRRQGV